MDKGTIIFSVHKVGKAVNSKWDVILDDNYIGQIDFENSLKTEVLKGRHTVQYKVGFQKTKVLEVMVGDEDVVVECVFNGNVDNFYVVGVGGQKVNIKKGNTVRYILLLLSVLMIVSSGVGIVAGLLHNGVSVVEYEECDNGALINMTLDEFCVELNENIISGYKEVGNQEVEFDIMTYMDNMAEPQYAYQTETGCPFTLHSAFVQQKYMYNISIIDNKISSINVCFDYDDNTMPNVLTLSTISVLSGLDLEQSQELLDMLIDGIMSNTCVYKDGVLYSITEETVAYTFVPASEGFVKELEASGSCRIVYWE